eukprot:TRINITY_DN6670_c0_g1_i2.p2 TRINITY_DN6670_c0_g1~~TRINITY_DN6670_c0_g1_i2.p2  ORF type:complete len:116 (-),score=6.09 TRINITY_DN6670_c0_g1_i2:148-495(-)
MGDVDTIAVLLKHGARIDLRNGLGFTPERYARVASSWQTEPGKSLSLQAADFFVKWFTLRPLHAFCVLRCARWTDVPLVRVPPHLQHEVLKLRRASPALWPDLLGALVAARQYGR